MPQRDDRFRTEELEGEPYAEVSCAGATWAVIAAALALGCNSSPSLAPPLSDFDGSPPMGDAAPPPPTDATSSDSPTDASTTSDSPLGMLSTIDEPSAPCTQAGGTKTLLFSAADAQTTPAISRLGTVVTQRFGDGPGMFGSYATFDPTGANPQIYKVTLGIVTNVIVSEGATVGVGAANNTTIVYQRYNAQNTAIGQLQTLASGIAGPPNALWMGAGGGGSLVVWALGEGLHAAGVTAAGVVAGPAFDFATGGGASFDVTIAYGGTTYALAWTAQPSANTYRSQFVLATPTGLMGAPVDITTSTTAFHVVKLVPTPTGFALLFAGILQDDHIYVVPLSATGAVTGPAHRYLGADVPWDLAAQGTELGLVVEGNDVAVDGSEGPRTPLFRPLDATGHPLAPWVCLGNPVPAGQTQDLAIDADETGYAIVYPTETSDEMFLLVDHLGQ
jgi:hypothetical protein